MASRFITTSFAMVSAAALLAGCDSISNMFGGKSSQSASTGASRSTTGSGAPTGGAASPGGSAYGSTGTAAGMSPGMSSAPTETVSAAKVKSAQQALKDQGFYKGRIDGIVGPQTRDAVARYQRDHHLAQTAIFDDQTLRSLDSRMSYGSSK
jgi:peptidoglycan hydrolase-like protein with peptidoglycan-binding domain